MSVLNFISKNKLGLVIKNKRFSELTTMKVGGKIKILFYPNSIDSLIRITNYLKSKNKKYLLLGNGSNIVASDRHFNDVVISGKHLIKSIEIYDDYFVACAFTDLRIIIAKLVENQIATFTNLAGIPATLGGALVMNSGAFKSNISDDLLWVKFIEDGKIIKKEISDLSFGYRDSCFKNKDIIILEAGFKIIKDKETLFNYKDILEKRRERHPLNYPNCGSVFQNGDTYLAYDVIKKINLANYNIGGAKFSEKHSNFIVNYDFAKAKDVYKLINLAKKRALNLEGISLKEEVLLLNFSTSKFNLKYLKK